MVDTTGKKLSTARLAKGLTVDEVAFATKLRPDKVRALEHDDYSRFPNNAYVKGFLQIYGRFLGVDVSMAVKELENPNPVSVSDYQYLNQAPAPARERITIRRKSNKPSLAPLIVFLLLCCLAAGGGYLYLNAQRLGNLDQLGLGKDTTNSVPDKAIEQGVDDKAAVPAPPPVLASIVPGAFPSTQPGIADAQIPAGSTPANVVPPVLTNNSGNTQPRMLESDRDFINQTQPAPAVTPAGEINEVVLMPVKKTWVKVRRDDPNSAPIFEDYLYTSAPPLKLRGARFYIEVGDEGAVTIRKNGAPIAFQGSGVAIQ